jgi:hypothetical protein
VADLVSVLGGKPGESGKVDITNQLATGTEERRVR